jgi:hypothetical protein
VIRELLLFRRLKKEGVQMRKYLVGAQWANALVLLAQVLNQVTGVFPALAGHPAILVAQAVIGALLPSLGGVSHAIAGTEVVPKS